MPSRAGTASVVQLVRSTQRGAHPDRQRKHFFGDAPSASGRGRWPSLQRRCGNAVVLGVVQVAAGLSHDRLSRWLGIGTSSAVVRPQTSNVVYALRGGQIQVSLTEDRAKTKNLRRDPRVTLHVSVPDLSAWAAVEADADLSPVTTTPGDETGRALAQLYVQIAGTEHPDWDEYYRAMVAERRLLLTLSVAHGYGGRAG